MVFPHSNRKLKTEICARIVGYCCDRPGHIIFGRIVEGLWNSGQEDPSSVQSLVSCSVEVEDKQVMEVWLGNFQKEVAESKTLLGLLNILS